MAISKLLGDEEILREIGHRLQRRRIDLQLTQAGLAEQAGVAKRTVERLEAGGSTQLSTLIRILRVLDLLGQLDTALPETGPRPLELLKLKGKTRQRVSAQKTDDSDSKPWSWGDEQ